MSDLKVATQATVHFQSSSPTLHSEYDTEDWNNGLLPLF